MRMDRAICLLVLSGVCGCSLPEQRADFDSSDPQERVLALGKAASEPKPEDAPYLIHALGSDDPAMRMLAIGILSRWTGETFGFDYAATPSERAEAIERWNEWAASKLGQMGGPES